MFTINYTLFCSLAFFLEVTVPSVYKMFLFFLAYLLFSLFPFGLKGRAFVYNCVSYMI